MLRFEPAQWRALSAISIIITIFACGHRSGSNGQVSRSADIATDLPDDGGTDKPSFLYWVTDNQIFRGQCTTRDVLLRTECTHAIRSMAYPEFKTTLDGGLSTTIQELQAEASRIQATIATLNQEMQATLTEIDRLGQQSGGLSQKLQALRDQMNHFQTIVQGYQEQLALINRALQTAVDQDMSQLRDQVMQQLAKYQTQLTGIATQTSALMQTLQGIAGQIQGLQAQLDKLTTRLTNLKTDLAEVQQNLQRAYDDFSVYQETLDQLISGIVHPILSDNAWWQKQRQFVRRFDQIFTDSH